MMYVSDCDWCKTQEMCDIVNKELKMVEYQGLFLTATKMKKCVVKLLILILLQYKVILNDMRPQKCAINFLIIEYKMAVLAHFGHGGISTFWTQKNQARRIHKDFEQYQVFMCETFLIFPIYRLFTKRFDTFLS